MSASSAKSSATPPVRSIAGERRASTLSNAVESKSSVERPTKLESPSEKNRDRSASSSSSSSYTYRSSSSDSLRSYTVQRLTHDGESPNNVTHESWSTIQEQLHSLRRMVDPSDESPITLIPVDVCRVCLEESPIRPSACCSSSVCSTCLHSHLTSHIMEARIRISCPSCPHVLSREEILFLLAENDQQGDIAERYKRFYADINGEAHRKTCPQCCAIKELDKKLFEGVRWRKHVPRRVVCDECQFVWCFFCHAPWHEKMSCKEYREGEKMLRSWAAKKNQNQQNAQRCPRCKVFISRSGGCPHMICAKCHCDFCYNCGKRRLGLKFLGSHDSRLSPFGCKYNLYPDKPILRHTVRGLVAGAATLAAPVAAVGAVALLAVGTTIGAPTYGTYRLVKHIRAKQQARRRRAFAPDASSDSMENKSTMSDDDEITRAIEESKETYREEMRRRGEDRSHRTRNDHDDADDDDDDDDDSFDD